MSLTNWYVSIRGHWELLNDTFWSHTSPAEVAQHLLRHVLRWPIRSSNLNGMVLGLVLPDCPDVRGDLAVLQLQNPPMSINATIDHAWHT